MTGRHSFLCSWDVVRRRTALFRCPKTWIFSEPQSTKPESNLLVSVNLTSTANVRASLPLSERLRHWHPAVGAQRGFYRYLGQFYLPSRLVQPGKQFLCQLSQRAVQSWFYLCFIFKQIWRGLERLEWRVLFPTTLTDNKSHSGLGHSNIWSERFKVRRCFVRSPLLKVGTDVSLSGRPVMTAVSLSPFTESNPESRVCLSKCNDIVSHAVTVATA